MMDYHISEMYQLINTDGDGLLLNLYLSLRDDEISLTDFETHLRNLLLPFLYNQGQGQLITPEQWVQAFGFKSRHVAGRPDDARQFKQWSSRPASCVGTSNSDKDCETSINDDNDGGSNTLNMSLDEYHYNSFLTINTHAVCWKLDYRGKYGETPLHFCYFLNTPEHLAIANYMLKLFPKLAIDKYEGECYYGQNCLHFAITQSNFSAIEKLISCGADVNSRACGSFFIPDKLKRGSIQSVLLPDYNGQSYFGEYPLVFAACLEKYSIFDQLYRDERTNPNFQDIFGNTLAHLLVVHNKPRFLYYALKLPQKRVDLSIVNHNGMTPLQLACHLGYYDAFQVLADARSKVKWRFGHLESKAYLIDQLDSLNASDGTINWNSGLHLLCMGSNWGHTDIINRNPVVDSLLRAKWQTFVKRRFGFNLVLSIIYLIILIAALYLRPSNGSASESGDEGGPSLAEMIKMGCEITLIGWSLLSLPYEWGVNVIEGSKHLSKGRNQKSVKSNSRSSNKNLSAMLSYVKMVLGFKDKLAANVGSVLLIMVGVSRYFNFTAVEDICLATSIPFLFGNLLFYCRCFSHLGPFITVYYHMIRNTLSKILVMFFMVTLGTHCIFYFLSNINETPVSTVQKVVGKLETSIITSSVKSPNSFQLERNDSSSGGFFYVCAELTVFLIHASFGDVDMNWVTSSTYPGTARFVLMQHGLLVTILLCCLMTAWVCATYQQVMLSFRAENKKQWARIILLLEAQISRRRRLKHIDEYIEGYFEDPEMRKENSNVHNKYHALVVTIVREMTDACRRNRAWENWRKLKYGLRKRHFVIHDNTTLVCKKLMERCKKRSSDPFMLEQLKENRRRVSINKMCKTNYNAIHNSSLMQNALNGSRATFTSTPNLSPLPLPHTVGGSSNRGAGFISIANDGVSSEYSEIHIASSSAQMTNPINGKITAPQNQLAAISDISEEITNTSTNTLSVV